MREPRGLALKSGRGPPGPRSGRQDRLLRRHRIKALASRKAARAPAARASRAAATAMADKARSQHAPSQAIHRGGRICSRFRETSGIVGCAGRVRSRRELRVECIPETSNADRREARTMSGLTSCRERRQTRSSSSQRIGASTPSAGRSASVPGSQARSSRGAARVVQPATRRRRPGDQPRIQSRSDRATASIRPGPRSPAQGCRRSSGLERAPATASVHRRPRRL